MEAKKIPSIEPNKKTRPIKRIPKEIRNLYNIHLTIMPLAICQENEESIEEMRVFSCFILVLEAIEYLDRSLTYNDAWFHPNKTKQEGWIEAIMKEFNETAKRKL